MGVGAVVIVALVIWMCSGGKKEETVEFETAKAERQDIHTTITATGTIEPVTSVTVGHGCRVSCRSSMWTTTR